jgi:precorrin-2 methylase
MTAGKVWFVGAGPGDPELITVKGQKLLARWWTAPPRSTRRLAALSAIRKT